MTWFNIYIRNEFITSNVCKIIITILNWVITRIIFNAGSTGVTCKVLKGGIIGNEKTIQLLDSIISFPMVSEKDKEDIKLASNLECDFIIINHSRSGKMIRLIKNEIKQTGL